MPNFPWPAPPGSSQAPIWTDHGFVVDGKPCPFLSFGGSATGWTENLTEFHESICVRGVPIDVASRKNAVETLRRHLRVASPVVLEIGSSTGLLLEDLPAALPDATIIGSDWSEKLVSNLSARLPAIPMVRFDILNCPFPANCLDAAVALNVLEHIEDDCLALRQIHRILKPGGIAYLELPAGPHLFDLYDQYLMHCRRYSLRELREKVLAAGFDIVAASHLGFFVYPAFAFVKRRNQKRSGVGNTEIQRIVEMQMRSSHESKFMSAVFAVEGWLGKWVSYPCGIRCLITCRKRLA